MRSCCWTQSLLAEVISVTGDGSENNPSVSHMGIEVMCMARVKVSFLAISSLLAGASIGRQGLTLAAQTPKGFVSRG